MKHVWTVFVVGFFFLALFTSVWLDKMGFWDGYDSKECRRLQKLMVGKRLREELTHWVDDELDLELLDWSDTGRRINLSPYVRPGHRYILEPDFDLSMLGFASDEKFHWPQIRLITPGLLQPAQGVGRVFADTTAVVFVQVNRVAILVRMKGAKDFGVNREYLKRIDGRVAIYCEPRD